MPFKNKQTEREYRRAYYRKHREAMIARARNWNRQNPERVRANQRKFTGAIQAIDTV